MTLAALRVAIRCALAVAVHSTVACDARGWHGECIEGHAGDSKKHIRELRGSELPPVSERLPRHSGFSIVLEEGVPCPVMFLEIRHEFHAWQCRSRVGNLA